MASSCSSTEKRNFQCITVASVDLIKLPLRNILASHIKPVDLYHKIKSCLTLKLRPDQLKICLIPPPGVPDYNKFDVTLLYTLIRNLCSLPCPAQGWGNEPSTKDTQTSDDIERLRLFRNNYYAHAESAVISDAVFEDVWKNLKLIFRRIQPKTGCSVDYEEELIKIERTTFTDDYLTTFKVLLEALVTLENQTDGRDEPTVSIRGENEIIWGDKAHFEADVKKADSSCWSITWHRRRGDVIKCIDTSMENYSGSTKRKLVINSVCKEDEGEYQALLSFESKGPDYKSRNTIRLHVIGDVPSVSILVDSPVCFGSETIIKSEVSSTPTPERTEWQKSKDGTDFHLIGKPKMYFGSTEDFKSPFLVIPKTTFADKLFYRLLVWNRVGKSASNTIYLNVTGSPPNITTSFVTNIKSRSVKLMGEVYFFDNSPGILKTFWTKNGEKINIEESGGKLSEMITHNPSLTITNVGPDDAGEYKVTATNAVGSTTSEVIVLGIPSVFSERVEDEKNGGRRIIVTITSFPAPCQIQWNAKSKDDDTFTPIDINAEEYDGTTVTFPNPVLVVRQRDQLEKKCYQIEVTNFIGKTVQTISGNNKPTVRRKDIVQNTFYKDRGARVRFTKLSNILAKEFPPQKLENLKFTLTNSNIVQNRTSVMEATSALECIRILQDEELFTQTDVIVMQFLCTQTECLDLHAKCVEYAEQQKALCYFEKPPVNGYKNAQFHVKGELSSYTKDYIQDVLETVAAILDCKVEDILLNGVRHSKSFLLFLSVKEVYMKKLLALNEQGRLRLIRLNIDYLIIDKETINLERPKGETCDNNPVVLKNTAAYLGLRTTQSFKERSPSTGVPLRNQVTSSPPGVSAPLSDIPDSSEPDDNQKSDFEDSDKEVALIFSPKIWKRYLSYVVSMENAFSLSYQLTEQTKFEGVFIAGSFGEGIKSIWSYTERRTDCDFMLRLKGYVAVERQLNGNNPNANIVKIEHSELYPGYALLRTSESRDISSCLSSRHFFTPDLSPITLVPGGTLSFDRYSRHGPALMFEFLPYNSENSLLDNMELDVVVYIHCDEWPSVADEWIERNRLCWPSGTMIADIVEMGCDLVPKGAHGSENQSDEWNISFARAERHLLHNMSSAQLQTYVLFQIISKKYIFGERFHQIVDSYIFKTTFFWASEENDAMQWEDKHYIDYVFLCLRKLLQFVKEGNCPHFFMRNCNLLRGKLDDLQKRDFSGMLEKFTSIEYYKQTIHSLNSDARSVLYESEGEVDEETLNAMDAGVFSNWEETSGSVIYYALPIPTAQNLETTDNR